MSKIIQPCLMLGIAFEFTLLSLRAADWPCWRGPNGLGVSTDKNLPLSWSKTENVAWKTALPGRGASSPIVVGERIYVTAQTDDTGLRVIALERASGAVVWDKEVGRGKLHATLHNMATPTPVSDGERIWALFGTGDLVCLDRQGQVLWQRNLVKEFGPYNTNHGMGTSPMLHDSKLYVACMHQGPSYLLAVNALTGQTTWKKARDLEAKDEAKDSYSSPILVRSDTGVQLVLSGAEHLNAYDPATGDELWTVGGLQVAHPFGRTIAGPTLGEGVLVAVASGFQNRGYVVGVKPGGRGDVTQTHKLWTTTRYAPDCPTPVVHQGLLFCIRDDGMGSCLDLKTGQPHWQERLFDENVKVSPVAGDGKVYFLSGRGNCVVVRAGRKLEILARNELKEDTLSTPAISGGKLFLRAGQHLYCVAN